MKTAARVTGIRPRDWHRLGYATSLAIVGLVSLLLVIAAARKYPGDRQVFVAFILAYVSMAVLAVPKPRSYGYSFLAAFLFLGFCAKTVAYFALGIALVEPTGAFNGSGTAWDAALVPATVGGAAVIIVRVIHLAVFRKRTGVTTPVGVHAPRWYVTRRIPILVVSGGILLALSAVNLAVAFYQVGVSPKVVLPFHLSAPVEWLFVIGFAMWAATLVGWETGVQSTRLGVILLIPLAEAVVSLVTLSRAAYLFRALPYLAVVSEFPAFFRAQLTRRARTVVAALMVLGLVVSLGAVSFLRVAVYPLVSQAPPSPISTATPTVPTVTPTVTARPTATSGLQGGLQDPRLRFVGRELSLLIVGRWIGIEGTMSVSSHSGLSLNFFERALRENPATGESAIYQHISGASYQTTSNYVFLTTPGPIAVLYYSGSLIVVFAGAALLTLLLISLEVVASNLLRNSFTVSIAALAVANAIAQMDFPYLFMVFVVEQVVAVLALAMLSRNSFRKAGDPNLGRIGSSAERT